MQIVGLGYATARISKHLSYFVDEIKKMNVKILKCEVREVTNSVLLPFQNAFTSHFILRCLVSQSTANGHVGT